MTGGPGKPARGDEQAPTGRRVDGGLWGIGGTAFGREELAKTSSGDAHLSC
jgi:hypothetical protein